MSACGGGHLPSPIDQEPSETQDYYKHLPQQKWIWLERPDDIPGPYMEMYSPTANMCGLAGRAFDQIFLTEQNSDQSIPDEVPLNCSTELVLKNKFSVSAKNQLKVGKISPLAPRRAFCSNPNAFIETLDLSIRTGNEVKKPARTVANPSIRKEKHNIKERERRRSIRVCCDELNMLVPFCQRGLDKVTTLQWTTAYLEFIKIKSGDQIKEEFQKTFTDLLGREASPSKVKDLISQDAENLAMRVEP